MAIFDLKITLRKATYASVTEFKHDVRGYCEMFYRHECQCSVRQHERFAYVFVSTNQKTISFDHSTHVGAVTIERGDYSAECGIDITSLSRVFEEEGAVDLMLGKLRGNTRYISGQYYGVNRTPITPELLRHNNWDQLDQERRLLFLLRLLADLGFNQQYEEIELADENGPTGDIYSLIDCTVEEMFGPDAESIWNQRGDDD